MADGSDEERRRLAKEALRALTEDQRCAILERVRGTLAADGLHLTAGDVEVVLAHARGDISDRELVGAFLRPPAVIQ